VIGSKIQDEAVKKIIIIFLIVAMGTAVSACGIKGPPKPPPEPESSFISERYISV